MDDVDFYEWFEDEGEIIFETLCDRCGRTIPSDVASDGPEGSMWEGGLLCQDCYAVVEMRGKG